MANTVDPRVRVIENKVEVDDDVLVELVGVDPAIYQVLGIEIRTDGTEKVIGFRFGVKPGAVAAGTGFVILEQRVEGPDDVLVDLLGLDSTQYQVLGIERRAIDVTATPVEYEIGFRVGPK